MACIQVVCGFPKLFGIQEGFCRIQLHQTELRLEHRHQAVVLICQFAGVQFFPLEVADLLAQLTISGVEFGAPGGAGQLGLRRGGRCRLAVLLQALAKGRQALAQGPVTGHCFLVAFQDFADGVGQ
ncbi:hypothetical protein D3C84_809290 [compost metagenome]